MRRDWIERGFGEWRREERGLGDERWKGKGKVKREEKERGWDGKFKDYDIDILDLPCNFRAVGKMKNANSIAPMDTQMTPTA